MAEIGEDVVSGAVRFKEFIGCFGAPVREQRRDGRRCVYYRDRSDSRYWRFCLGKGRIVSALGNLSAQGHLPASP